MTSLATLGASGTATFHATQTGSFRLRIAAGAGSGAYTLGTAPVAPGTVSFTNKLSASNGKSQTVLVPAVAGATLDVLGKAQNSYKGKGLVPALEAPSGMLVDLGDDLAPFGAKGFACEGVVIGETGVHRLHVAGIKGAGKCVKLTIVVAMPIGSGTRLVD